jgi:DNA-cytosine methyltransferase
LNVLSLFDGCSCGRVALERAGFKINTYNAFEIDKYAIQVAQKNYPTTIQNGDVLNSDFTEFKDVDILLGGSPCTFWSVAKKNRDVDKSGMGWKLFERYLLALKNTNPTYFLYENVASMPSQIKDFISEEFGVQPILIDSTLVSAQQRKRLYWTNIPGIIQPEDRKIYLQDILEDGFVDRLKSYCIDASYFKGGNLQSYFEKKRRQLVFDTPIRLGHFNTGGQADRVYGIDGKSVTLSANGGGRGGKTGLYLMPVKYDRKNGIGEEIQKATTIMASDWRGLNRNQTQNAVLYCVAQRGRYDENGKIQQQLEPRLDGKTNTLTTVQKDNMVFDINDEFRIRKLTPLECERLQTLPDQYTEGVSNTQRYKMIGNGWTVDVISHILSFIK